MPVVLKHPLTLEEVSDRVSEYGNRINSRKTTSFDIFGRPGFINTPCDPMRAVGELTNRIPINEVSSVLTPVASQAPLFFADKFPSAQIHIADINPRQIKSTWGIEYFNRKNTGMFNRSICDLTDENELLAICEQFNHDIFFGSNILDFTSKVEEKRFASVLLDKISRRIPYVLLTGGRYSGEEFHKAMIKNGYYYDAIPGNKLWEARAYTLNGYCQ